MLFGFLSLLMGHWTLFVAKICVKTSVLSSQFYPCVLESDIKSLEHIIVSNSNYFNGSAIPDQLAASLGGRKRSKRMRVKVEGTRKKENPRKKGGSRVFLGRRGSRVFWKKKVRKSKEKNGPRVRGKEEREWGWWKKKRETELRR